MPGKRISELTALSGANSANNDDVIIFDATANETKRISRSQLAEGMQADVQVLTNKTIALGSNTVTGTTAQFNTALTDNNFATQAGAETLTNKTIDSAANTLTVNYKEAQVETSNGSRTHLFTTVAALLADTGTYTTYAAGQIVEAGGFRYEVAASGATDQNITTAGGVKLYALESQASPYVAKSFSVKADGVTDDYAAHQNALDKINAQGGGTYILPYGTSMVSQKLQVPPKIEFRAFSPFGSILKASAAMDAILEYASTGFLRMYGFQLDGNNLATDCFRQSGGLSQGSDVGHIRFLNPVQKGWNCTSFIYALHAPGLIFNGGQTGLHIQGNGPGNGATFANMRVSNTSDYAVKVINTAVSISTIHFDTPTLEGNGGGGFYIERTQALITKPYFESNGGVIDKADVALSDAAGNIITKATISDPNFSASGAAQAGVRLRILSSHCHFYLTGGNSGSADRIDGNSESSACVISQHSGIDIQIQNYAGATELQSTGLDKRIGAAFTTAATGTGLKYLGAGTALFLVVKNVGATRTSGLYLVTLDGSVAPTVTLVSGTDIVDFSDVSGELAIALKTAGTGFFTAITTAVLA